MGKSDVYFIKAALNAHTYLDLENKERLLDKNTGFGVRRDCFPPPRTPRLLALWLLMPLISSVSHFSSLTKRWKWNLPLGASENYLSWIFLKHSAYHMACAFSAGFIIILEFGSYLCVWAKVVDLFGAVQFSFTTFSHLASVIPVTFLSSPLCHFCTVLSFCSFLPHLCWKVLSRE